MSTHPRRALALVLAGALAACALAGPAMAETAIIAIL